MSKYKYIGPDIEDGVFDTELGEAVPPFNADPKRQAYTVWVNEGNITDPWKTEEDYLQDVKSSLKDQVDQRLIQSRLGIEYPDYNNVKVDLDDGSMNRIMAANAIAEDAIHNLITWNDQFYWRAADNSQIPMPRPQDLKKFMQWSSAIVDAKIFNSFVHKNNIDSLSSIDQVASYNIDSGW